jgi:chromate transport protein ChrA
MRRALAWVDRTLRGAAPRAGPGLFAVVAGGAVYGGVMGAFGGVGGDRLLQIAFSAAKVPLLILATTALALPSYFVLNTLLGLRADFPDAVRAVAGTQAAVAVVLASLAPFTAVWYASTRSYHEATLFNALMFGVASLAAQLVLRRRYAPLEARDPRHRWLRRGWLGVYAVVGIQMGWVLRPFIGEPGRPVTFFRADTWGNAYVVVADVACRALGGR